MSSTYMVKESILLQKDSKNFSFLSRQCLIALVMGHVQVKAPVMEQQELVCALKVLKGHLIHAKVIIACV